MLYEAEGVPSSTVSHYWVGGHYTGGQLRRRRRASFDIVIIIVIISVTQNGRNKHAATRASCKGRSGLQGAGGAGRRAGQGGELPMTNLRLSAQGAGWVRMCCS